MDYSQQAIKDYKYWQLQIHSNQGYLGRCVVWCKRENALDLTEATSEEREELFQILRDLKDALTKVFQPGWFNYAFLGNEDRHLHGHVIPRYASSREFAGQTFTDERWGHNYKTDRDFVTSPEVLEKIKEKLKEKLGE